jgi:Tol biopolymer transport system component/DNA-binding winged helix-turn-helix (wHTH) protein
MRETQSFQLGNCIIIPEEYSIQFDESNKKSIQPKFIEVLCYLAQEYPRVIPREEIIDTVWGGNNYVGEKALTNAIWHLRKELKGTSDDIEVIETIRKVGYKLLIEPKDVSEKTEDIAQNTYPELPAANETTLNKSKTNNEKLAMAVSLLVLISILWFWHFDDPKIAIPEITQITKEPGSELFAAPAPNGRKIVFKWIGKETQNNLFLKDRDNPQLPPVQLTFGNAQVGHSVWSNDGQYLYFSRKDTKLGVCQVIQMRVATKQETPLVDCPVKGGYYYLDISPDNKTLAFHGYSEPADDSGIYFLDLTSDTSEPYRFSCSNNCGYKERDFSFSPDGKYIAVTRRVNRFNENVYLVDLETLESEQVTFEHEDIVGLDWHPNKNILVYASQRADIRNGFIVNMDTREETKLQIEGFSYPAFALDTHELFYQQRSEKYHVGSLALDSEIASSPFPVIESDFSHLYPHYSPISGKIAYVSNESGVYELWVTSPDGTERRQLTNLQQTVRYPRWSNDGKKIAFIAPIQGERADKIYIYDLVSNTLSIMPSPHIRHGRPTWTYDDTSILTSIRTAEFVDLHKVDILSGKSTRLTFDGGRYAIMTSPTTMVYTREERGLWQREIDELESQPLNKIDGKTFRMIYSWDIVDNQVFFRRNYTNHHQLVAFDLNIQNEQPLIRLPARSLGTTTALSFNKDNQQLYFTHAEFPQADIKQLKFPTLL